MTTTVTPFLMFTGNAEEALDFYVSLFDDAEIISIMHNSDDDQGTTGQIKRAEFVLANQHFICIDSPIEHDFTFTPAISIFVEFELEEKLLQINNQLLKGGETLMPLDNYGFSQKFTWLNDRFGVSWQLNLA